MTDPQKELKRKQRLQKLAQLDQAIMVLGERKLDIQQISKDPEQARLKLGDEAFNELVGHCACFTLVSLLAERTKSAIDELRIEAEGRGR